MNASFQPGHRTVHCADALAWLAGQPVLSGASVITSLPDVSELPHLDLEGWRRWFTDAAALVMEKVPAEGVAIFFQTDIKSEGAWVDKGYLVHAAAERLGLRQLWHKIVCRKPAGTTTWGRPAYSHLLCYSRALTLDLTRATPDVIPDAGATLWTRGMGVEACRIACRYVLESTSTRIVVDPFCGRGTVLAVANSLGLEAVGVELSKKRARQAQALKLEQLVAPAPSGAEGSHEPT